MSELFERIEKIRDYLRSEGIDGWLLYDYHGSNRFARQLLAIPSHQVVTRRFFYWIPREGIPQKILHRIEAGILDDLPGEQHLYLSWNELEKTLRSVLENKKKILMEYSPKGLNPSVSVVDAGTVEMVREMGIEILSSADLLQCFTSVLSEEQIASHRESAKIVQQTVARAWEMIADRMRKELPISEYEVQQFISDEFTAQNCVAEEGPICAVNEHSALPHYMATQRSSKAIRRGDFILIDLWCKKNHPRAIYADITRVAVAAAEPSLKHREIFEVVYQSQKQGIDFVIQQFGQGKQVRGAEVDDVCRHAIQARGFGSYFTHRTGHNMDTQVHGAGAHLDNLETSDYRQLLPGMCFTIEPGVYLPGEFGVRLETDLLIKQDRSVEVTAGVQDAIICLL
jgi:Xaa-Pro dipeptidase